MNIIEAIQNALANCIHMPEVLIDTQPCGFKVTASLERIMAMDDALEIMNLCKVLTEWADENGFDPDDTPFHFASENGKIVFVMEFFKRDN